MPLSRLENFLRSVRGNIIYVDPNALDSTDSIENEGTSAARPFKTLQRALIEASRFSYLPGPDNDKFANTTILLYPGEHLIDNRPGWIPLSSSSFLKRDGTTSADFYEFDLQTNFDITTDNNALYKFNSIHGGVIVPRGTSIVGYDLRKTKIRPKYVPNPENDNIERAAIFRLTGACYLWQMSIFDADPNGQCFKDYTNNKFVPNFSHHKLTVFEYADGTNPVQINDAFNNYSTDRTDLDIYYEKIGLAYGPSAPASREIPNDYPGNVDIQTKIDEYRIVGSRGAEVGISSIFAGDSVTSTKEITVILQEELEGLDVDTPIRINGVTASGYNGQFVVSEVVSSTEIKYKVSTPPITPKSGSEGTLNIVVDTVTSASPYIFNCSLRSVYGLCGMHADGNSVNGFKSMVVAQFTGISLQKDNNAFVKYDKTTGTYIDTTNLANIYSDSLARYKPSYESYHIKASNNAFIQCVSIFAIGYAEHFVSESGGDMSITNSNSNFGAKALSSKGYREDKFIRDDLGYISHIIPPKEVNSSDVTIEFDAIDINKTVSVGNSSRLYLYNQNNENSPPSNVIDGFRIGAKQNDKLYVSLTSGGISTAYDATILMDGNDEITYQKEYNVAKESNGLTNVISNNVIQLTQPHDILNGETIRVISDTGEIPGGLDLGVVYFAITNQTAGIGSDEIKIASSLNDAENGGFDASAVTLYNTTSANLKIISRVSDKKSGDIGHPIQWDSTENQWYVTTNEGSEIYNTITSSGISVSPRTYFTRNPDNRNFEDTIYKLRYVIPRDTSIKARPPLDGYIIQDSTSIPASATEIQYQYSPDNTTKTLTTSDQLRHIRFISDASWNSSTATIQTELPHHLSVGSQVEILNVLSSNNPIGLSTSGFNGTYTIANIPSRREFSYSLSTDPGSFLDNTSVRNTSLPYFNRKGLPGTYIAYRNEQIQEYIQGKQDGIYHIAVVNVSNTPTVSPFQNLRFSQPIQYLYPQLDRDNVVSDPQPSNSFALPDPIGQVTVNDNQNSITRETLEKFLWDTKIGFGLTDIVSNTTGTAHTFYTNVDHGLNPITNLNFTAPVGSGYGSNIGEEILYNAQLTGGSGEGASAVIKINGSGEITDIELISGGSAYQVGDTLSVVGVATTTGYTSATVSVASIYDHTDEVIRVTGITDEDFENYNNLYRISRILSSRLIEVNSSGTIFSASTTGVGATVTSNTNAYLTGKSVTLSSFTYNNVTGIATAESTVPFGYLISDKVRISGANSSLFNGDFTITKINSLVSINLNVGKSDTLPATTGTIIVHPYGYTSKGGNNIGREEGRTITQYAGITATTSTAITTTGTTVSIANIDNTGLKIGDYLQVDDEIIRIRETVDGNPVAVFRGLLGTRSTSHGSGAIIKKVHPYPIELRRHSILRASSHTFEYVGFGPGNYSNAFPDRQDRQITEQEELLSQSFKVDGGINVYTGMNNDGDFYIGNKRVSSATGQEDVFDAPIPSVRGEEVLLETGTTINVTNTDNLKVTRSIKVEGGKDSNTISEFNGPVIFNNKITSNSDRGIEVNSIYLQGDATVSRKYTIGASTPTISGNSGDIEYYYRPDDGGHLGWVYTTNNEWRKFGPIQNSSGAYSGIWTGKFYGDGSGLVNVGSSTTTDYAEIAGISTVSEGLIGSPNLNVGVVTATEYYGTFNGTIDPDTSIEYANNAGVATYATSAGIATYAINAGPSNVINATNKSTSFDRHYPVFVEGTGDQTPYVRTTSQDFRFTPETCSLTVKNLIAADGSGTGNVYTDVIQSWNTSKVIIAAIGTGSEIELIYVNGAYKVIGGSNGPFRPDSDNGQSLGNANNRWSVVYAATGTINTSDGREKVGITTSVLGSDFIKSLRPVSYKWKVGKNVPLYEKDADGNIVLDENGVEKWQKDENGNVVFAPVPGQRTHWGFIAQDVKESIDASGVEDFAGWTLDDKDDPESRQGLRYDQFIAPLTKALQEALERIDQLEKEHNTKALQEALERIDQLEQKVATLEANQT